MNPWQTLNAAQLRRDGLHRYARAARHILIAAALAVLCLTLAHAALQTALALPVLQGHETPWKDL
jgi:hypothetical protein